jgi:PIN domain
MTVDPSVPTAGESLRVVVDAQIVLSMFLVRRDRSTESPTKRLLLRMLPLPTFQWLWTPDILADYERGALAIEQDPRIMRRAVFDRTGFQLLLAALRRHPPVPVSVTTLQEVRQQISQATHARQRDLDDAIYLACALDGSAQVLTSNDATLLGLGSPYAGVRIVPWQIFIEELRARGLIPSDT